MFQALNGGRIISKDLLFKDVRPEDRARYAEEFPLQFVDWDLNGDPYFFENRHTPPRPVADAEQDGGAEWWIFYNTTKFSGKKLVVRPGQSFTTAERGVHNMLVWQGSGTVAGQPVTGGDPEMDELLIVHDAAVQALTVENTGSEDLVIFKFFGPDINPDVPMLRAWPEPDSVALR
jgi:hypothetical protein